MRYLLSRVLLLGPHLLLFATLCCFSVPSQAQASADTIFPALERSVFQIRIIETKSGSLSAMGTGFLVGQNRIATNYHVVSGHVLEPEDYRIEIHRDEQKRVLNVLGVDVVSDLALLELRDGLLEGVPFVLAERVPAKGEILFSLGNPHNLGMTVVQGNYNGLVEHSFLERIHFSGAVNAGMSGGPTVDAESRVVGINVASAGNQIGFLVPVDKLARLLARLEAPADKGDLLDDMAQQIETTTTAMVDDLLAAQWPTIPVGKAVILDKTVDWLECWGNSQDDDERGLLEIARGCNNGDSIFVSDELTTGFFEYEFYYVEAKGWPATAFYRFLAQNTSNARPGNMASEDQVGNYDCVDRIVSTDSGKAMPSMTRRVSYCLRPYKTLPGLFDAFYIGVTQDKKDRAVMDHFTLAGVDRASAMRFLDRFVEVLKWQ